MTETTASNLKKLREYFSLSMSSISRAVGVSRNSWSRYERGICRPNKNTAKKIINFTVRMGGSYNMSEKNLLEKICP